MDNRICYNRFNKESQKGGYAMKQREKRFISLFLSGVMLLSNLPLSVLAEEVVEEETAVVTGQAPAASRSLARESADRQEEESETEDYPVWVDDKQLTSDTENAAVSYDPNSGVLTLRSARLDSLMLKESMTLALEGSNTIGADNGMALQADGDLTLSGTGSLTVNGDGTTAMVVNGRKQGDSRWGLTVEDAVTLTVTSLTSPEGITLGEGTHVKLSRTTGNETFALGSGYLKTGAGSFASAGKSWVSDGSGLEFVGTEHVQWVRTDARHHKTCIDSNCPLVTGLELEAGEHNTLTSADCKHPAKCNDCGEYGQEDPNVHTQRAVYDSDGKQHWKAYSCCGAEVENTRQDHEMVYSAAGKRIDYRCKTCQYGKSITLQGKTGENYVYNGKPKEVWVVNDIDDTDLSVDYLTSEGNELPGPPTEAGTYTARVKYQGLEARMSFVIEPVELTEDLVTLSSGSAEVGQQAERPTVKVAEGVTCKILYSRDGKQTDNPAEIDWESAGTVTIAVTGTKNYTGTVTRTYTIRQAKASASMFQFTAPEDLTYNGEKKEAFVTTQVEDMGNFELCYDGDPVSAGTYRVKVQLTGDGNYETELLEDDSWCFTIEPTDQYTDNTKKVQVIGAGIGEFQTPSFSGVGGEAVAGTCVYTLDGGTVSNEYTLLETLKSLEDGTSVTIGYTFTPNKKENYAGDKSGSIQLTKMELVFSTDDGDGIKADVPKTETVPYGTDPLIDVSKLKATLGKAVDEEDSHFTVEFTQDGHVVTTTGDLDVGTYGFTVYYSNPNLGGYAIEKVKVTGGWLCVTAQKLTISAANQPKGGHLIQKQDGSAQPLLTEENAGQTDNGLKLEYSLSRYGNYSSQIPEASEPGSYTIWYRAPQSGNYDTVNANGSVEVVIFPWLTAIYGELLRDIRLSDGFTWNDRNPETDSVGNAGEHIVLLNYGAKSLSGIQVPLTVKPKEITVSVTILEQDKWLLYTEGTAARARVSEVRNETDHCVLPANQYTLHYEGDTGRGEAKVWPVSNGNYAFTAEPQSYSIYDPVAATLTDNALLSDEVKQAGYANGMAIREALDASFPEEYPAARRKFTYFLMKTGTGTYDYTENGWPEKGLAMKINYPTGTDGKDSFKVYDMYLVDYKDIKAGTIVEMKQAKDALGMCEYTCYDEQICLKMPTYMAVAIGAEAEKYTLKRNSSTRGTITFTVGDDTTALTFAKVRAGETVTVHVTDIQANYGVFMVEYYETALGYKSSNPSKASQNADGTYSFEMPEYDTTIKVTIRKSSGNPKTGDVIRFWVGVMTLSGAGVAGLLIWQRKKRK